MAERKRQRGTPTGKTPVQEPKRQSLRQTARRKRLSFHTDESEARAKPDEGASTCSTSVQAQTLGLQQQTHAYPPPWNNLELQQLTQYILLHDASNKWPTTKDKGFWTSAAQFVSENSHCPLRTGTACRTKVIGKLHAQFRTPTEAEEHLSSLLRDSSDPSGEPPYSSLTVFPPTRAMAMPQIPTVIPGTTQPCDPSLSTSLLLPCSGGPSQPPSSSVTITPPTTAMAMLQIPTVPMVPGRTALSLPLRPPVIPGTPHPRGPLRTPLQLTNTGLPSGGLSQPPSSIVTVTPPITAMAMLQPPTAPSTYTPVSLPLRLPVIPGTPHPRGPLLLPMATPSWQDSIPLMSSGEPLLPQQRREPSADPNTPQPSSRVNELHLSLSPIVIESIDRAESLIGQFLQLSAEDQLILLDRLFSTHSREQHDVYVPHDYLTLSLNGMKQLKSCGRHNTLYHLAKGLGTMRDDGSDSRFPAKQMPMGLFEYATRFFAAENIQEVRCPPDYRMWTETMYTLFGNRWLNLHGGPMWRVETTEQEGGVSVHRDRRRTVEARANVPTVSASTIRRHIAASSVTLGAQLQTAVLDEARAVHPSAQWWIKADGCDIVSSLGESTRRQWSGDVDLGDGEVQKKHQEYLKRLSFVETIVRDLTKADKRQQTLHDLQQIRQELTQDLCFVAGALQAAVGAYEEKLKARGTTTKVLFNLGWTVDELKRLNESGRKLKVEVSTLVEKLQDATLDVVGDNVARRVSAVREATTTFIEGLSRHQRTMATHVLVIMISPEVRNRKPYALPLQCIPYKGIDEKCARMMINKVVSEMHSRGMAVSGFVSNGEYNNFRVKGYTRPLSIFRVRSKARAKYKTIGEKAMMSMLTARRLGDGRIVAEKSNPAVSQDILQEIMDWKDCGVTDDVIIDRLRKRTVPASYSPKTWKPGETEGRAEKLRSILSQFEYQHQILHWESEGVPFRTHIYVPEVHPITGQEFHEREDDAHLLKRIATATRGGGPDELQLERFEEALHDETAGLTYPAFTGQRKQSVRDAECLFSASMADFMKSKGYQFEMEYITAILNWRRASDERGLSELQRSRYNYHLLNFLLDDLMPWHRDNYDFSLLEVNRPIDGVQGLTRETLIGLTTTIESREWKRRTNVIAGLPKEHPRASTTDDVECFFSVLRDLLGKNYTVKQLQFGWRKVVNEFMKRLDPDTPFYYHTSVHHRFHEGPIADFNEPGTSRSNPRNQRVRRRELLSGFSQGRVSLPTPGARSTRMQFHNVPLNLPPPPGAAQHTYEHSY